MEARRFVLETDEQGRPKALPSLPPFSRVEAVFTVLEEGVPEGQRRRPAPELANLLITGDVLAPVLEEHDWNLHDP